MNFLPLVLQFICGMVGGALVGCGFASLNLGRFRNCIAGLIGGGILGQLFQYLFAGEDSSTDMEIFLCSVVGGALGGSLLVVLAGCVRHLISHKE